MEDNRTDEQVVAQVNRLVELRENLNNVGTRNARRLEKKLKAKMAKLKPKKIQ